MKAVFSLSVVSFTRTYFIRRTTATVTATDSASLSERATRKKLIDPKLTAAGWRVEPFDERRELATYDRVALEEFPTDAGPADYALVVKGRILGIVEAKKLTLGPQNVLTQTER